MADASEIDPTTEYEGADWLTHDDAGWHVTDLAGFMVAPGWSTTATRPFPASTPWTNPPRTTPSASPEDGAVHFSRSVAQILSDNYDALSKLDGFDASQVDSYIEEALTGEKAETIAQQTNLLNATEIMLGVEGLNAIDPAKYFRVRSGTADQHTSFSIGFNIALAAQSPGMDADYHLVWNMPHGSNEGSSTGTFIDWINQICKA